MIKSRSPPNRARSGPVSLVARIPPMVARSGQSGSHARRWPCSASVCCKRATVQPASTVAVMSAQACSITRSRRVVESTRSAGRGGWPQSSFVPPPRGITTRPSRLASRSCVATSSTLPGSTTRGGGPRVRRAARSPPSPADAAGRDPASPRTGGDAGTPWWGWTTARDRRRSARAAWCRGPARRTSRT